MHGLIFMHLYATLTNKYYYEISMHVYHMYYCNSDVYATPDKKLKDVADAGPTTQQGGGEPLQYDVRIFSNEL